MEIGGLHCSGEAKNLKQFTKGYSSGNSGGDITILDFLIFGLNLFGFFLAIPIHTTIRQK